MQKMFLLGDEAIGQAALDAGLSGVYAYPGTPSTEITEYIQRSKQAKDNGVRSSWTANEKTSMEAALGMSYAGKRAMTCMKHVGLNVAADAFVNSAITGVNGGLIIVVADDPSMHSSQNEQDSRFYGDFALIPILEPRNQQEAYDMVYNGFELSEKYKIPVMMRITTRIAHSRAGIERMEQKKQNPASLPENPRQFVLLPNIARKNYAKLIKLQDKFEEESEQSLYNQYIDGSDKSKGIIVAGIANNYVDEAFEEQLNYPVLRIGQYPLPAKKVKEIYDACQTLYVIEDGYPFIEKQLRGVIADSKIKGKLDGTVIRTGELNPDEVAYAFALKERIDETIPEIVSNRPPALCPGCGHTDVFNALNEVLAEKNAAGGVFSDIGCYTLAALPPLNAINTCVDMGASITMAKGAADAGMKYAVAFIGDSTFTHSGMTGLLDCVIDKSPVTVIISDNSTTGMTGGQKSHAEGRLFDICLGLGVEEEHIRTFNPLPKNHELAKDIIKEEVEYEGVSVIIPQRECVRTLEKKIKSKRKAKKAGK